MQFPTGKRAFFIKRHEFKTSLFKANKKNFGAVFVVGVVVLGAGGDVFYFPSFFQSGRQWEELPLPFFPFQSPRDHVDQYRNSPERVWPQNPKKTDNPELAQLLFFGFGIFHSHGFYNGNLENCRRTPRENILHAPTRTLICMPHGPVVFFLVVATGRAFD